MRKKVLIVYRNCSLGGVSSVILDRIELLQKAGYDVHCIFQTDAGGREAFENVGASVDIFLTNFDVKLSRLIFSKNFELVILLSHFHLTERFEQEGMTAVGEYHGSWLPDLESMKKFVIPKTFVVPGEWSATLLSEHKVADRERIVVCPNKVRWNEALPPKKSDAKRAVWVGRIGEEHKNWRDALSIFAFIKNRFEGSSEKVRFSFVFSLLRDQKNLIDFLNAANSVGLMDIELYYNVAPSTFDDLLSDWATENSLYLSTSKGETFGLAAAQALAAGIPAVIAKGGAVESVFGDFPTDVCKLYERGEWLKAAEYSCEFLEKTDQRLSEFKMVREKFTAGSELADARYKEILES